MNNARNLFFLLLAFLLFTDMTCSPDTQPPKTGDPTVTSSKDCVNLKKIQPERNCARTYNPVCGCNDETYYSECEAEKAGVSSWKEGACTDCLDKTKISRKPCAKIYDPVCGCDGATYPNKCEAENAGIQRFTPGMCPKDCRGPKPTERILCPSVYQPVCGCDGQTYSNGCKAKLAGVLKWDDGPCSDGCIDKSAIRDTPCTTKYDPVCGCNGETYSNSCVAKNAGVLRWESGKCKEPSTNSSECIDETKISLRPCPEVYKPVCGCDGKTYTNQCNAQISGVTSWENGACEDAAKDCIDPSRIKTRPCPENYDPVCGCDGKTYGNECEAGNAGVTSYEKGECKSACIDESKIDPTKMCTMQYDPVCGCDGKTYGNACEADRAGVTSWKKGACGN